MQKDADSTADEGYKDGTVRPHEDLAKYTRPVLEYYSTMPQAMQVF